MLGFEYLFNLKFSDFNFCSKLHNHQNACVSCSCAVSNVKKVSLELGGKSPLIIFNDCDLDKAVRMVCLPQYHHTIVFAML